MKRLITLLILTILLTGCFKGESKDFSRKTKLNSNVKISEIEYPISNIGKPLGLKTFNNQIYVIDDLDKKVKVLNKDGSFLKVLENNEVELIKPQDLDFFDEKIYIADNGDRSIKIFDKEFNFLESINMPEIKDPESKLEQMAVLNDDIYLVYNVFNKANAYIYKLEKSNNYNGEEVKKIGEYFIGNIFKYENKIYAVNSMEYFEDKKTLGVQSGKNDLYIIEDEQLKKLFELPEKYTPFGIAVNKDEVYLYTAAYGRLDKFNMKGNYIESIMNEIKHTNNEVIHNNYLNFVDDSNLIFNYMGEDFLYIVKL